MPHFRTFALRHTDVEVVFINVDVNIVQGNRVPPIIRDRGLENMSHVFLDSDNPDRVLREHVPGWASELPTTIVADAAGNRISFHAVAMSGGNLEAALAGARE
jgi:hypothetical protein